MIGYLCKSLRIITLVWPTRLIFLAMGEVFSFGFNLAVSFPSDSSGSKVLGNVVISKKFLCTRKIMVMYSNERGVYIHTLEDR